MNIGIVTSWFPAGAGYVSRAYRNSLEKEHKVFVYARAGKKMINDPIWDDNNVIWAPKHYLITGININHFEKWIRNNQINIIIFNEQRYWLPIVKAKKMGVFVGAYVDYYTQDSVNTFAIYDFLICNTLRHYSVFNWHPHCYYVPWGTDVKIFTPKNKKSNNIIKFLASSGWEGSGHGDRRGTLLAMRSFINVRGNCKLIVYSQIALDKCTNEYQNLVRSDKRIEFRFGTYEPFPFEEGDVYLYPSRLDGIGLSLPEALSSGLAAITTDCAPMNEFVKNDLNGFLVDVEKYLGRHDGYYWAESIIDSNSLTEKMQRYVDDPSLIRIHGINARLFAEKTLDWDLNSIDLLNLFRNIELNINPPSGELISKIRLLDSQNNPSIYPRLLRSIVRTLKNALTLFI